MLLGADTKMLLRFQETSCRPLVNKPPPIDRDYDRDPNIKALKRRRLIRVLHWQICRTVGVDANDAALSAAPSCFRGITKGLGV